MASLAHKRKLTENFTTWLQYRWNRIPLKTKKKNRIGKILRYNRPHRKLWELDHDYYQ
jgi:hypothetical protein